jgi:hypothetical protein
MHQSLLSGRAYDMNEHIQASLTAVEGSTENSREVAHSEPVRLKTHNRARTCDSAPGRQN